MRNTLANLVCEVAGVVPDDIPAVELHECFAHDELITYEGLGLCAELVNQLRGTTEKRQVEGGRWRCSTIWDWEVRVW